MENKENNALPAVRPTAPVMISSNDPLFDILMDSAKFSHVQRVADLYSKSGLVPDTFRGNVAACFVGMQLAMQLRVNPFMLFQKIYFIGGKPAIETQLAIAIANKNEVFDGPIEYVFTGDNKNKTRSCTASAVLSRNHKRVEMTIDWSIVDGEGWSAKGGSKWKTMPDQMFRYRSAMWLIRTYAPEVLFGMYSRDEVEDGGIEVEYERVPTSEAASMSAISGASEISFPAPSVEPEKPAKPPKAKVEKPKVEKPVADPAVVVPEKTEPVATPAPIVAPAPAVVEKPGEEIPQDAHNDPERQDAPEEVPEGFNAEVAEAKLNALIERSGMNIPAKKASLDTLLSAASGKKPRADWKENEYNLVCKTLQSLIDRQAAQAAKAKGS